MTPLDTILASGFRGRAAAMQPADVAAGARRFACPLAMMQAMLDVESSGHGYDATGRPKMLPERHWFFRFLAGKPAQAAAVAAGLAYPVQGTLPYPSTSDGCYALLERMAAVAPEAAIQSCSWGIAQVMGFNFAVGDYADAAAMVAACLDSEANQFGLMLGYLEKHNLVAALRALDFDAIAVGYNGRGASAAYAAKLRAAYAHHAAPVSQPPKLAAPALANPPLHPNQLSCPSWLAIRNAADNSADDLNAAELSRIRGELP